MPIIYCQVAFPLPIKQNFTYVWNDEIGDLMPQLGCRVEANFGSQLRKKGWVVGVSECKPQQKWLIKPLLRVIDSQPLFDVSLLNLAEWLAALNFCSLGEALEVMLPGAKRERELDLAQPVASNQLSPVALSSAQLLALSQWRQEGSSSEQSKQCNKAKADRLAVPHQNRLSYLYGVTGSGKTEVFLRAASEVLEQGKGIIYLVPEINLVYQLQQQLSERFGAVIALLHSQLTAAQKLQQWRQIQQGEATVVLGVRSAVFAPLPQLGLIIIDEEHESSYKSGRRPRYHARQVAMRRCKQQRARLIMGSATPSLEAWQGMESSQLQRLSLPERIAGKLPAIELVDLNHCRGSLLAPITIKAVEECCEQGKQAIFFLNQRGYSKAYHCFECRQSMRCRNCSITLTFHQQLGRCICHYCGYQLSPPSQCPQCGGDDVGSVGIGTEQLEQQLKLCFPHLRVRRLDSDSTSKRGSAAEILRQMAVGEIDILIGTQMVAKGLHFPQVQLVGIALADTSLNLADFRANERCFAQLLQVSGRAGRLDGCGRVLLQTYQPQHPLIQAVLTGKIEEFYRQEQAQRRLFGFPPFSRLFRLLFRSTNRKLLWQELERWRSLLDGGPWLLMGPADCALEKVASWYRAHILLFTEQFNQAHAQLSLLYCQHLPKKSVQLELDSDPLDML